MGALDMEAWWLCTLHLVLGNTKGSLFG